VAELQDADFEELVAAHRRELQVHCYRILGSVEDAEEALQDTLVAAWRHRHAFEGRSSLRTWLYRIATNRCLDQLRAGQRRPEGTPLSRQPPPPTSTSEVEWLQPYPDVLLPDPADVAVRNEDISLAYVRALQLLPPRQRVVLVLRDVLQFRAAEVAEMLDMTEEAVTAPSNEPGPPSRSTGERTRPRGRSRPRSSASSTPGSTPSPGWTSPAWWSC
jgi:RNA polymerase sigma-70 factor (ECF subfamily)